MRTPEAAREDVRALVTVARGLARGAYPGRAGDVTAQVALACHMLCQAADWLRRELELAGVVCPLPETDIERRSTT